MHSLWEYKNKVQNWSFCWLCLALSYLVVTKTKNKNPFFCFFNFVRSFRDKKDVKICLANRRDKVAPNITKKKKLKFRILYFVSHKEWPKGIFLIIDQKWNRLRIEVPLDSSMLCRLYHTISQHFMAWRRLQIQTSWIVICKRHTVGWVVVLDFFRDEISTAQILQRRSVWSKLYPSISKCKPQRRYLTLRFSDPVRNRWSKGKTWPGISRKIWSSQLDSRFMMLVWIIAAVMIGFNNFSGTFNLILDHCDLCSRIFCSTGKSVRQRSESPPGDQFTSHQVAG